MSRLAKKLIVPAALASLAACDPSNTGGSGTGAGSTATGTGSTGTGSTGTGSTGTGSTGTGSTGTGTGSTGTGSTGTGTPATEFKEVSIKDAIAQGTSQLRAISIKNATVVAVHLDKDTNGQPNGKGTFYIQDGSGPGLAVYRGYNDGTVTVPAVGDVVDVKGHFTRYNGIFEVVGRTGTANGVSYSHPLSVTKVGTAPVPADIAGTPASYAMNAADKRDAEIGNVIRFDGPLSVTKTGAILETQRADGGTRTVPAGFEVEGGLVIHDQYIYNDCLRGLDGGVAGLKLDRGVRGVWDRYQDFNAGSASAPAPTVPVLYPMNCSDLNP
jgi:hypothetical protein